MRRKKNVIGKQEYQIINANDKCGNVDSKPEKMYTMILSGITSLNNFN